MAGAHAGAGAGCTNAARRLAGVEVADTAGGRAKLPDSLDSADMEAHSLSPGLTHEALETSVAAAEAEFFKSIQQDPAQVCACALAATLVTSYPEPHPAPYARRAKPNPEPQRGAFSERGEAGVLMGGRWQRS